MKKCLLILGLFVFSSCESAYKVEKDISSLREDRKELIAEVWGLISEVESKRKEAAELEEKLKELKIYESGKSPQYILKIKLKQSRFSLDLMEHVKDGMNAIEFEIPVDKDFYNNVKIGTKITDEFRMGSFILNGSFSSWDMTVEGKIIHEK